MTDQTNCNEPSSELIFPDDLTTLGFSNNANNINIDKLIERIKTSEQELLAAIESNLIQQNLPPT